MGVVYGFRFAVIFERSGDYYYCRSIRSMSRVVGVCYRRMLRYWRGGMVSYWANSHCRVFKLREGVGHET